MNTYRDSRRVTWVLLFTVALVLQSCGATETTTTTEPPKTRTTVPSVELTVTISEPLGVIEGIAPVDSHLVGLVHSGVFDASNLDIIEKPGLAWHQGLWETLSTFPLPTGANLSITGDSINLGGSVPNRCYLPMANALVGVLPPTVEVTITAEEPPDPWADLESLGEVVIYFDTGSAEVSQTDRSAVERLGEILAGLPGSRVKITGHTDVRGDDHDELSTARASIVASVLIAAGVPNGSVTASGAGDSKPAAVGENDAALQLNRRVEITVDVPEQPPCTG